mgnify:FL=1
MFADPGRAYVYFIYGMYFCFNVVCEPDGVGAAVLVRGGKPVTGINRMAERRGIPGADDPAPLSERQLAKIGSGPGKLCQALAIRRDEHNGTDLTDKGSPLFITAGTSVSDMDVLVGSRIGIREARERPWRFGIRGSCGVSRHPFVIAGPE